MALIVNQFRSHNHAKNTETNMQKPPPLIWLPMDHRLLGDHDHKAPFLVLGEKYARAITVGARAQPVLFPLADEPQISDLLGLVDGVMLTGSPSNVHPRHFEQSVSDPALPLDPARDSLTLALVKACLAQKVPLFGVCRGFQEINVALGGSLHQRVHQVPGLMDHREPSDSPIAQQYAPRHEVRFTADSRFARWAGGLSAQVNSLHGQGIARLAPGLRAVGHAPDGLVEAFEVEGAASFACAVQWHPEWHCWETPFYSAIFEAFGQACRERQRVRLSDSVNALQNAARSMR